METATWRTRGREKDTRVSVVTDSVTTDGDAVVVADYGVKKKIDEEPRGIDKNADATMAKQ